MRDFFKIKDSQSREYGIDVLRALAILAVVLYHVPRYEGETFLKAICYFGWAGVDLFFVLSGFLIAGSIFKSIQKTGIHLQTFYLKRLFRTLPPYYLILFVEYSLRTPKLPIKSYFYFAQGYTGIHFFSVSWSLCIEEHFYLVFPLFIFLLLKFDRKKLYRNIIWCFSSLLFISLAFRFYTYFDVNYMQYRHLNPSYARELYLNTIYYPTHTRLDGLCLGIILANIKFLNSSLWEKLLLKKNLVVSLFSFFIILGLGASVKKIHFLFAVFGFTFLALAFAFLILMTYQFSFKKFRIIENTALISYSIYLAHYSSFNILAYLTSIFGDFHYSLRLFVFLIASYVLGYILYIFWERPWTNLRRFFV